MLKGTVRRARPVYNLRSDFSVVVAVDHFSFPSGHSSRWVRPMWCRQGGSRHECHRLGALQVLRQFAFCSVQSLQVAGAVLRHG